MENPTAVDGGAALIIISAILAFSRGLVRELMAIIGWIGAAIAAYYFAPGVQPPVKELPVVGEFLSTAASWWSRPLPGLRRRPDRRRAFHAALLGRGAAFGAWRDRTRR